MTVTLCRLRLCPGGSWNLPKAGNVPYLEFPILVTLPPFGLPLNLSARSNGWLIFSQEKLIFFEQIQRPLARDPERDPPLRVAGKRSRASRCAHVQSNVDPAKAWPARRHPAGGVVPILVAASALIRWSLAKRLLRRLVFTRPL